MKIIEYTSNLILPVIVVSLITFHITSILTWLFITRPLNKLFYYVRLRGDFNPGARSFTFCHFIVFKKIINRDPYYLQSFQGYDFRENFSSLKIILAFVHFYSGTICFSAMCLYMVFCIFAPRGGCLYKQLLMKPKDKISLRINIYSPTY